MEKWISFGSGAVSILNKSGTGSGRVLTKERKGKSPWKHVFTGFCFC